MKGKTLKDIIPATSDYNLAEGQQIPKELREKYSIREDWNGYMSGEWARKQLRQAAREQIKDKDDKPSGYCQDCDKYLIDWIKHFFNLEDEDD